MAQMNVSIPEPMKAWCEGQVAAGAYSTTSDYVRDLIRRDQEHRQGVARLQAAITEAIAGGISPYNFDEIIAQARQSVAQ